MRVTCPSCLHSFQADDNESGKTVRCPACGDTFAAPVLMHPAGRAAGVSAAPGRSPAYPAPYPAHGHAASGEEVSFGAPPPAAESAGPAPGAAPAPPPSAADLYGLTQLRYIPLRLSVVRWIPVVCLILAFLLTFFTWVGAYPAGYAAYTQSGWQAMFASFSTDAVSDTKVLKDADGNGLSMRIKEHISPNLLMLPFLLFLALAMVLAVWVQLVEMGRLYVPVWAQRYWPYRMIGL
ncbi:MAG TPA: MJ0042-type zinc finger domain-containing protein, partial [Gemmataceae bacterium]